MTSTFYVGKPGSFNIVLIDERGNKVDSPAERRATIIVTTLATLDEAKAALNSNRNNRSASATRLRTITLAKGQQVAQLTVMHRRGEKDEVINLVSNQTGRLHIYVESEGLETGETVVVVLDTKRKSTKAAVFDPWQPPRGVMMMPVAWQEGNMGELKLDIQPINPIIQTDQGEQLGFFKVELLSVGENEHVPAPQDMTVILRVEDGYAKFVPDALTIHKGEVVTRQQAQLRTRPGGLIKVSASTPRLNNTRVIPVSRSYEFRPGIRSTSLAVHRQRGSAYANGLDEIELRVEALQDGRVITPEEEGMEERKVFFRLEGDSEGVKFENGRGELSMGKRQETGTIKLFSSRPVGDLKVVAESFNGLRDRISTGSEGVPVRFSFPWLQMLCAMLGGLMFPLLRKQQGLDLVQGLVVGLIFFGLALFGAMLSDPQNLGTIKITLTKLPTENALASFILGFLGSTFLLAIFKARGQQSAVAGVFGARRGGHGERARGRRGDERHREEEGAGRTDD